MVLTSLLTTAGLRQGHTPPERVDTMCVFRADLEHDSYTQRHALLTACEYDMKSSMANCIPVHHI